MIFPLTSGTIRGVPSFILKYEELSTTLTPLFLASSAKIFERDPSKAKKARSKPSNSLALSSLISISLPLNFIFSPTEFLEAKTLFHLLESFFLPKYLLLLIQLILLLQQLLLFSFYFLLIWNHSALILGPICV